MTVVRCSVGMGPAKLQHLHFDPTTIRRFVMLKSMTICRPASQLDISPSLATQQSSSFPENRSNDGVEGQIVDKVLYRWH